MHNSTQDNESEFFAEMQDVKPLKQDDKVFAGKPKQTLAQQLKRQALEQAQRRDQNYLSIETVNPVEPLDMLSYKKPGVQEGVYKNLRLGKYKIETALNVQHCRIEQARDLVFDTVLKAQRNGTRCLARRNHERSGGSLSFRALRFSLHSGRSCRPAGRASVAGRQ